MIRIYLFECEKCGYSTKVAGGLADGQDVMAETIVCEECRELQDAIIALKVRDTPETAPLKQAPPFVEVANQLSLMGPTRWEKFEPNCSNDPLHRIKVWKQPGKCPRCGVFIEPSAIPFREWK